jgi:hypothetical protein
MLVQVAYDTKRAKSVIKAEAGHFEKAGIEAKTKISRI